MAGGIQLLDENIIISPNLDTWADIGSGTDFATWDDWTQWATNPDDLEWESQRADLGVSTDFTLSIETDASGEVTYEVYVSNTGAFSGEETTHTIAPGDTNIEAFTGQFFYIVTTISSTDGTQPTLRDQSFTSSDETFRRRLVNQNTANLSGVASAKELDLGFAYSKIVTIFMTPHQPGGWVVPDYWADGYTETAPPIFPNIVQKTFGSPKISLATYDGVYTEGVVDIEVVYLPGISMIDGNLVRS